MDKRSITALLLIALIIIGGEMVRVRLFPPAPSPVDSLAATTVPLPGAAPGDTALVKPIAPATAAAVSAATPSRQTPTTRPLAQTDTVTVVRADRIARFVNVGASPVDIALPGYKDLKRKTGTLSLTATRGPLMRFRIASASDTISLDDLTFTETKSDSVVEFVSASPSVRVKYELLHDNYLTRTTVSLGAPRPGAKLLVDLAPDLKSGEADTTEDLRHLAYAFKRAKGDVESVIIQKLDTARAVEEPGPLDWVAIRNKYFAYAVIPSDTVAGFASFRLRGGHPRADGKPTGIATATMNMPTGAVSFDLYTGPQSWTTLRAVGHELSNVNPYAGWAWLRPVVQPFATIVMRLLLWMKKGTGLGYGWVLVIFGVSIRMLLWPLNQTAMRTSIKMQKLQPELAALQKRYAKDPEAQRQAMMKLYQEHDMSPLSPLMGCLPMLLPMPILFALYFVFQNTIEFRGVQFLWLPDISLRDPYYITPIVMGLSMLVLSWIGMRAAPPNPQAKVMGYMMPAMFTMMFLNFASGLNLYYAVQNLVAIPQQWLLTRERKKAGVVVQPPGSPPR